MLYLNFFTSEYLLRSPSTGIITPNDLPYLKRLYIANRDAIQSYYLDRHFAVKNTHILSRILEHFPVFPHYDVYRYLEFTHDRTKYLAKHFKFTSDIEKGIVHPSYFFGNNGEEIILSNYEVFDPMEAERNWKTSSVISVVRHNRNDTKLLLPLGNEDGSRSGLDIVSINIPKLAIKYREFIKEQAFKESTGEGLLLNKNHFIIKYVLHTLIEDIIDHIFLNKVMDKFYGREEITPRFKHRFKLFEPQIQLERYVDNTLDIITHKKLDFVNILRNIQLIFKRDASELLSESDMGQTRQTSWALLISKLPYMIFLYDVSKDKGIMNKHVIEDWKRAVKRIERDNSLFELFSYEQSRIIKEQMYQVSQM